MNITYTQNGDYIIQNIVIRKTKPIGHYGRLRKAYLETYRPVLFNELVLSDTLYEHCAEIDEAARNRMELIVPELVKRNGVTEQLKAENQMEWVRQMKGNLPHTQKALGHQHHLALIRSSIPRHRLFYLHGSILKNWHAQLFCRQ